MITTRKQKPKTVVGLDIGASSIAAAELRVNGRAYVSSYGVAPIDSGLFRDGEVQEPNELGDALKELFSEQKLSREVRLGIANQRIAVRTLSLPRIEDRKELETAIRFQAQEHIPVPLEQAVLDWQVIPSRPDADVEYDTMEVVTVAARKDMLAAMMEAVNRAGLRLVGIDLSAFALIRALAGEGGQAPTAPLDALDADGNGPPAVDTARLYCHLGDMTNLAIARGRYCVFTRVFNFGIEGIAQSLAERTGLTLDHARQWLGHVGLDTPLEAIDGDPKTVSATRDALTSGAARLADELRRSIEYFDTAGGSVTVESVVVAGPGTAIPGLVDRLRAELPLALDAGTPAPLATAAGAAAPRLTLAYGLGLEE